MKKVYESFSVSQVLIGTTATLINAATPGTDSITIENMGTTDVYIGKSNVTTATGFLLPGSVGASITLPTTEAIYGVVGSGSQNVSVLVKQ